MQQVIYIKRAITYISLSVVIMLSFTSCKEPEFVFNVSQYILLEDYSWESTKESQHSVSITRLGDTDIAGDAYSESLYKIGGYSTDQYVLHKKTSIYSSEGRVYMHKDTVEPIMCMEVNTIITDAGDFGSEVSDDDVNKIIKTIRESAPIAYCENVGTPTSRKITYAEGDTLICNLHVYFAVTFDMKYSCKIVRDAENNYYVVRYDTQDDCYYKHKIP